MTGQEFMAARVAARVPRIAVAAYVGTNQQNIYTFEMGLVLKPRWPVNQAFHWIQSYQQEPEPANSGAPGGGGMNDQIPFQKEDR